MLYVTFSRPIGFFYHASMNISLHIYRDSSWGPEILRNVTPSGLELSSLRKWNRTWNTQCCLHRLSNVFWWNLRWKTCWFFQSQWTYQQLICCQPVLGSLYPIGFHLERGNAKRPVKAWQIRFSLAIGPIHSKLILCDLLIFVAIFYFILVFQENNKSTSIRFHFLVLKLLIYPDFQFFIWFKKV